MVKCLKLRYINKIRLLFEFQKEGGFNPQTPLLGAPLPITVMTITGAGCPSLAMPLLEPKNDNHGFFFQNKCNVITVNRVTQTTKQNFKYLCLIITHTLQLKILNILIEASYWDVNYAKSTLQNTFGLNADL